MHVIFNSLNVVLWSLKKSKTKVRPWLGILTSMVTNTLQEDLLLAQNFGFCCPCCYNVGLPCIDKLVGYPLILHHSN